MPDAIDFGVDHDAVPRMDRTPDMSGAETEPGRRLTLDRSDLALRNIKTFVFEIMRIAQ